MSPAPKNPRRITPIGALRFAKPDEWARAVKRAIRDAGGRLDEAAEALEISRRTLRRWISEDEALPEGDRLLEGVGEKLAPASLHRTK